MNQSTWYAELMKPEWAPEAWVFGPVWSVLYLVIFISFGAVFWLWGKGHIPSLVALPFLLNLLFNFAFTPLQFALKSNLLASIDILLVLLTLLWAMWAIYPLYRILALVQIPYLLWVLFATVLQLTITYLNI